MKTGASWRRAPHRVAALCLAVGCAHPGLGGRKRDLDKARDEVQRAEASAREGRPEEAESLYRAASKDDPAGAAAWVGLGDLALDAGRLPQARKAYRRALYLAPHHPGASNGLARVLLARNEDLPEAQRLAEDALRQESPQKARILDTLFEIYRRAGRYGDAQSVSFAHYWYGRR